jgi:hypothetical protein
MVKKVLVVMKDDVVKALDVRIKVIVDAMRNFRSTGSAMKFISLGTVPKLFYRNHQIYDTSEGYRPEMTHRSSQRLSTLSTRLSRSQRPLSRPSSQRPLPPRSYPPSSYTRYQNQSTRNLIYIDSSDTRYH